MKTVRSKSQLLKLPPEVLDRVNLMIVETGPERKSYEEIAAWVNDQGFQTSRSAVDRYAKYLIMMEKVKLLGEQAKVIIDEAGTDSPLKLEEAASKLGAVVMMELFQEVMQGDSIDPAKIGRLMGDLARLQASSVQRERLKADFSDKARRFVKDAEKKAKTMSKEELVTFIKERVYGLA